MCTVARPFLHVRTLVLLLGHGWFKPGAVKNARKPLHWDSMVISKSNIHSRNISSMELKPGHNVLC